MKATDRVLFSLAGTGLALLAAVSGGCKGKGQADRVSVVGSTSVQPFAEMLAEGFQEEAPDIQVAVQGGGSSQGISALSGGIADVGMCSRDLTDDEKGQFTPHVVARDGIAIVVHPDNRVRGLTKQQVQDIFAGKIVNWKEVGGADHAISVVLREDGSGTREAFTHLIMGKVPCAKNAMVQGSNGAVKAVIKGNPHAVGFMSLGQVKGELKAVEIDGQVPSEAGVARGEYNLWRPFLFVTKGAPKPAAQKFLDFALSQAGQKILEKEGLVGALSAAGPAK